MHFSQVLFNFTDLLSTSQVDVQSVTLDKRKNMFTTKFCLV